MQSVSSRIWTRAAVSISYDDNHYTTGTSHFPVIILNEFKLVRQAAEGTLNIKYLKNRVILKTDCDSLVKKEWVSRHMNSKMNLAIVSSYYFVCETRVQSQIASYQRL